ncbi:ABC transporter substrate-binding protein [Halorubrum ezzemoulense]|uniref:ABC transporter substrate-binding protein n=3 Tax=Halorubrum ezzemoulense TaxID=337243 RepID=A0A256JKQ0_HALEZ|nr:ABC transporter substrate-binding protein [Halorubrum ezzemoulense]OSO97596.1 hypothetical protein B9H04_12320 [Halorubrum ezzemoulense DSM 17463]PHQ40755.1 hypothetical protein Z052_18470 [Halorubrum sp. C191]TKX37692.1 ABC transporter substrate-binding protein [Halorubrum sp. CGM5_25_10-8B]MDB2226254.1 ABC transporter substrate-binding protein [Halorubrum ezzemoulense]MDB2297793.1 ABC transporter substrate-binding protein [Halorubrum ezzemoulense]
MPNSDSDRTRRRFLQSTGALAAMTAVAGCSGGSDEEVPDELDDGGNATDGEDNDESAETTSDGEKTLRLLNASINTFDPPANVLSSANEVIFQVFDGLVGKPEGKSGVVNQLATEYEISDDGLTYTFTLTEDVVAHNGSSVGAADVVYSWERVAASPDSSSAFLLLSDLGIEHETNEEGEYVPGSMAVEAVDDRTVEVTLSSPYYAALDIMSDATFAVLPEGIVGDIEGYDGEMEYDEFTTSPVGTGPFEFDTWTSGEEMAVTAFDEYHGEAPMVDRVHWQVIEDTNAQYNYAMNRNVDAFSIPTAQYDPELATVNETQDNGLQVGEYGPVQNGDMVDYLRISGLSTQFMLFNNDQVIEPARKAVAWVMDHEEIANSAYKGRVEPGYHMTPATLFPGGPEAAEEHARENYPYGYNESNIEEARLIMEEAGYSDDDPYEFEILNVEDTTYEQISNDLRDRLSAAHIEVSISTAPFSTLLDREFAGNRPAGLGEWGMSWADPLNVLALLYPPNTRSTDNEGVSGNPLVALNWVDTEASQTARDSWNTMQENSTRDDAARERWEEALIQMEEANWEDCAMINYAYPAAERFSYDWVDMPEFGELGALSRYTGVDIDTDAQP